MPKFYFTFGCGQSYEGCYHVIKAETRSKARQEMWNRFDNRWSMQYDSAKAAGVKKYKLKEIK